MKTLLKIGLATVSVIVAYKLGKGIGYHSGMENMYKYKKDPNLLSEKERRNCKIMSNVLSNTETLCSTEGFAEIFIQCGKDLEEELRKSPE
jgi:hypothetical protein|nr:MAG TPA: hypothetical protein [Bacteriophage sp.]